MNAGASSPERVFSSGNKNEPSGAFPGRIGRPATDALHSTADDGNVAKCWGVPPEFPVDSKGDPKSPGGLIAIDAGESHVCAITGTSGEVVCWGAEPAKRSKTETGSIDTDTGDATPAIVGALEIGAGRTHSCALLEDGAKVEIEGIAVL